MLALRDYGSSDEDNDKDIPVESNKDLPGDLSNIESSEYSVKKDLQICAAPIVVPTVSFCIFELYTHF